MSLTTGAHVSPLIYATCAVHTNTKSVGVCVLRENRQKEDHKEGPHSSRHMKLRIMLLENSMLCDCAFALWKENNVNL